jgi:hypothetical protein
MAKGKYEQWLTDEGLTLIKGWAREGLTDEQIAHNMGIAVKTLYNWKNAHMPILQALKKGKEVADFEVENALFQAATGFQYKEEVLSNAGDVETVERYQTPNTTAIIFWLKNRKPEKWRDKQQVEHSGSLDIRKQLAEKTDEELKAMADKYEKINRPD